MKCGEGNTISPELSLLKSLPLDYHHSHFLAATLDLTSFFTTAFLGTVHSWAVLDLIIHLRALYFHAFVHHSISCGA